MKQPDSKPFHMVCHKCKKEFYMIDDSAGWTWSSYTCGHCGQEYLQEMAGGYFPFDPKEYPDSIVLPKISGSGELDIIVVGVKPNLITNPLPNAGTQIGGDFKDCELTIIPNRKSIFSRLKKLSIHKGSLLFTDKGDFNYKDTVQIDFGDQKIFSTSNKFLIWLLTLFKRK